jgi:hypothetical protein
MGAQRLFNDGERSTQRWRGSSDCELRHARQHHHDRGGKRLEGFRASTKNNCEAPGRAPARGLQWTMSNVNEKQQTTYNSTKTVGHGGGREKTERGRVELGWVDFWCLGACEMDCEILAWRSMRAARREQKLRRCRDTDNRARTGAGA